MTFLNLISLDPAGNAIIPLGEVHNGGEGLGLLPDGSLLRFQVIAAGGAAEQSVQQTARELGLMNRLHHQVASMRAGARVVVSSNDFFEARWHFFGLPGVPADRFLYYSVGFRGEVLETVDDAVLESLIVQDLKNVDEDFAGDMTVLYTAGWEALAAKWAERDSFSQLLTQQVESAPSEPVAAAPADPSTIEGAHQAFLDEREREAAEQVLRDREQAGEADAE